MQALISIYAWILVVSVLVKVCRAGGHLQQPRGRLEKGMLKPGAGPCEVSRELTPPAGLPTVARKQILSLAWPRNNNPGGFIRISWAIYTFSDSPESFHEAVDLYACYERVCAPTDPLAPNGSDQGSLCSIEVQVPSWLPNGAVTMQWAYFGGGSSLGDYYSCVDLFVFGGGAVTVRKQYSLFKGGDWQSSSDKECKFFNTNRLGVCTKEPCTNGEFRGQMFGAPKQASEKEPPIQTWIVETPSNYKKELSKLCEGDHLDGSIKCVDECCGYYLECSDPIRLHYDSDLICSGNSLLEAKYTECTKSCNQHLQEICSSGNTEISCINACSSEFVLCENAKIVSPLMFLSPGIICIDGSITTVSESECVHVPPEN